MDNEIEKITQALINGDPLPIEEFVPKSRSEEYLKSALMKTKIEDLPNPQSRLDVLLCALNDNVHKEYSTKFEEGYSEGYDIGNADGHNEDYEDGYANGYEAGTTDGNAEGYESGHSDGYDAGREVGHAEGYEEGFTSGHTAGHTEAYNTGYESGFNKGYDIGHTEDYDDGYSAGHEVGLEDGKQAEKKAFWDTFFNFGKRKEYRGAFGACFDETLLKDVPYTITPVRSFANQAVETGIFYYTNRDKASQLVDISHIKFDFSKIGFNWNLNNVFMNAAVDNIILDLTPIKKVTQLFSYSDANTKPTKITLTVTENLTSYSNPFHYLNSSKGVNIQFTEGSVIAASISFSHVTYLVVESAINIINTLKNYAGTDQELTYTLTFPTEVWDRLEASGITPPSESTWKDYVYSKGWLYA